MGELELELAGEPVVLLPERALWWPRRSALLVADPHWGKAAAFRAGAIPVPRGTTFDGLQRLDQAVLRSGAKRVIFLGDFLHSHEGRAAETLRELMLWRDRHSALSLVLVRGNHDLRAGDPPAELGIECLNAPLFEPPFVLSHFPRPASQGYVLAGHLHPAIRLVGPGRQRERLPCFWLTPELGVLPAFGAFTGSADISPAPGDRVFAATEHAVLEIR
jgi:DNA ligase-associated metallophosphoesterase